MHHFLNGITKPITQKLTAYLVYRGTKTPVVCRICGKADRWEAEGKVWVCEHWSDVPIRNVDHIKMELVDIVEIGVST